MDGYAITIDHVKQIANWATGVDKNKEIPFIPGRIVLQDFTGVPVVVNLAAMRATMSRAGGDAKKINPLVPVDLVIDHSVMVDAYGTKESLDFNVNEEFERNDERYRFLRWVNFFLQPIYKIASTKKSHMITCYDSPLLYTISIYKQKIE